MVDKLTQGQLEEFKKFAQDPEYFSLPLRNVSVYTGNTKIEGFAFDRGYQRKAARVARALSPSGISNILCSKKWATPMGVSMNSPP